MDIKEVIKRWKGNHRYTLKLINAMPLDDGDFKPTPAVKSFLSQCSHITTWLRTHSRFVMGKKMEKAKVKSIADATLALDEFFEELIHYLERSSREDLEAKVKVFYGNVSKLFILQTMDNHLSHHRGQMVIYLRLKGVKPASYVGW